MNKQTKNEEEEVEGSTPSPAGPRGKVKQEDDSKKPSKTLDKEAVSESEAENMTGKKGYNETPPTVSVKKGKV